MPARRADAFAFASVVIGIIGMVAHFWIEQFGGMAWSGLMVAAGILLSRIAGLVREGVFSHYFGTTLYADVFRAGLRMPNVLQNLLGEGTLSASFIPVYSELLEQGREEEAGRMAGAVFGLLFGVGMILFGQHLEGGHVGSVIVSQCR